MVDYFKHSFLTQKTKMRVESITISDFYNNPDEVRDFILTQDFNVKGNYPGNRTKSFLDDNLKNIIQNIIKPTAGDVTWWGDENSGAFQYTTANDRSWIHSDNTDWAAVCYLTPDAPLSSGTGLFRNKETKKRMWNIKNSKYEVPLTDDISEYYDMTKWELVDRIGNLYNRLIIYRGDLFHVSLDYFGKDLTTGRLFQTFFFNTEF
jgi:hypothetical protein